MSDLPQSGLLQQLHARAISGEHLELLGKQAAAKWASGSCDSLNAAVITTVKHAGLSPEQVKRVCEFANTGAYLDEFKKEGSSHRYIDFPGGPADPSFVLQDLNDGGGGSVFDRGTLDYDRPPPKEKHAAADPRVEAAVKVAFAVTDTEAPMLQHNPYQGVMALRDKLAAVRDFVTSEIDSAELQYADIADRLYQTVKQAALSGQSLGEVLQAWGTVAPSADFAKVAFQLFTPRLFREGVFHSTEALANSLTKTAANVVVNQAHPAVLEFAEYCDTLQKLAAYRALKEEARAHHATLTASLKQASAAEAAGKALGSAWRGAKGVAGGAGSAVGGAMREANIPGAGLAEFGISHSPHLAALLAANDLRLHATNSPLGQHALELVPGTPQHEMHKARIQQGF